MTVQERILDYINDCMDTDYSRIEVYVDLNIDGQMLVQKNLIPVKYRGCPEVLNTEVMDFHILNEEDYNHLLHPDGHNYRHFDEEQIEEILVITIANNYLPRFGRIILDFDLYDKDEATLFHALQDNPNAKDLLSKAMS